MWGCKEPAAGAGSLRRAASVQAGAPVSLPLRGSLWRRALHRLLYLLRPGFGAASPDPLDGETRSLGHCSGAPRPPVPREPLRTPASAELPLARCLSPSSLLAVAARQHLLCLVVVALAQKRSRGEASGHAFWAVVSKGKIDKSNKIKTNKNPITNISTSCNFSAGPEGGARGKRECEITLARGRVGCGLRGDPRIAGD